MIEGIFTLPDVFSADECEEFIAMSERIGYDAAPISAFGSEVMRPDIRNNARVMIDDEQLAASLWARIKSDVPPFLSGRQAIGLNERLRFYRYDPGQKFAMHADGSFKRLNGERSMLTFMVYLNDDFVGGETVFIETTVKPQRGMVLIFHHGLLHEGTAVISGRKYVIRSDVMYSVAGRVSGA